MKIFFSIVSHLHHDVIINLETLKKLHQFDCVEVVCRDNQPINKLRLYCEKYGAHYLSNKFEQGFATNNNQNFVYCQKELGMKQGDLFILLNPDMYFSDEELLKLISLLINTPPKLATCNLYLDKEYMVQDDNVRLYPKFCNFVKTYLFNDRTTMVNREKGFKVTGKHWASGSCLIVESTLYENLKGLDESYYLYCEDIDLCYRAKLQGEIVTYLESISAVHYRRRDSKRFLSQYFFWHVGSVLKYSFFKKRITARKSCILLDKLVVKNKKLSTAIKKKMSSKSI